MYLKYFQVTNRVWIYDVTDKQWTRGPSLITSRSRHSCMVDQKTETIYVLGGSDSRGIKTKTTWTLKLKDADATWEMGPELKENIFSSAAVSSKSSKFIGYLVGGWTFEDINDSSILTDIRYGTSQIWALQRTDMQWIELSKSLRSPRYSHSVVNVDKNQIPRC